MSYRAQPTHQTHNTTSVSSGVADYIGRVKDDRPSPPVGDVHFEVRPGELEIWHSDRIATEHPDLVDQSADWLENEMGVLNLVQIDYRILMADGLLTDAMKNGLIGWWAERVEDLNLG